MGSKLSKNIIFIILISTFTIMTALPLEIPAAETVKVNGHEYSPYQNTDQTGFQNELVKEAFTAAGLNAEIKILPPKRTIYTFYIGKYAVCADGETITDEKKNKELNVKKINYWKVPLGLMYYKPNLTSSQINNLESAKDFSDIDPLFTILSYGGYNPFNEAGFRGKVKIKSDNPQQTYKMVRGGRYDLGFEVLGVTPYFISKTSPEDLKNWGFLNFWIYVPQYMAFNGNHPKGKYYEEKFREGLSTIKKNGKYLEVYERLYGKNNVPKSAIADPQNEIRTEDLSKIVKDKDFDMEKFLRQERDESGSIVKFVN